MKSHARIRLARRRRGLSQTELATAVGVQRTAVSHWESPLGKNPTVNHLRKFSEATGVRFEWLTTGRGPMGFSKEEELDSVQAAHALLVDDDLEMRFLKAFREVAVESRISLVEIAEQIASLRVGRPRKSKLSAQTA